MDGKDNLGVGVVDERLVNMGCSGVNEEGGGKSVVFPAGPNGVEEGLMTFVPLNKFQFGTGNCKCGGGVSGENLVEKRVIKVLQSARRCWR